MALLYLDGAATIVRPDDKPPLTDPDNAKFKIGKSVLTEFFSLKNFDSLIAADILTVEFFLSLANKLLMNAPNYKINTYL